MVVLTIPELERIVQAAKEANAYSIQMSGSLQSTYVEFKGPAGEDFGHKFFEDGDDDDEASDLCPECARSYGPHYRGPCEHGDLT